MKLNFKQYSQQGSPLIILHGLFGSLKNWNWQARQLSEQYAVYGVDLRNHGSSPHLDTMNYPIMAADVLEFLDQREIDSAHVLGHSMGGKVAMQLALTYPQRVDKLVVVDIAPIVYAKNRGGHEDIFNGLEKVNPQSLRSRAEADEILANFLPERAVRQFLLSNLEHRDDGGFRWRFNLSTLKNNYADLRDKPEAGEPFDHPVLFVKGDASNYITDRDQKEIRLLFPQADIKVIPNAGHWVHAEKPKTFNTIVRKFLAETPEE